MWRPSNWDNIVKKETDRLGTLRNPTFPMIVLDGLEWDMIKRSLVEVGADAILKELERIIKGGV